MLKLQSSIDGRLSKFQNQCILQTKNWFTVLHGQKGVGQDSNVVHVGLLQSMVGSKFSKCTVSKPRAPIATGKQLMATGRLAMARACVYVYLC